MSLITIPNNINQTLPMLVFLIRCGVVNGVVSLHFKAGDFFEILNDQFSFSISSATKPASSITALS